METNLKIPVTLVLVITCISGINSQQWQHQIKNDQAEQSNFYTIQRAFENAASLEDESSLNGYKIFKRWEWYMQGRVDADGRFPTKLYMNAFDKLRSSRKNTTLKNVEWTPVGPFNIPHLVNYNFRIGVGRIDCIAFHPTDDQTFWIGAPAGGLWKTEDAGDSWIPLTDNLPVISISDIAVNPYDPDIIYIATGERDAWTTFSVGILKSTDGGLTWDTTGINYNAYDFEGVYNILINPLYPDHLLAGTRDGIYKSVNGGDSWNKTLNAIDVKDMEFKPNDPQTIYASSFNIAGGAKLYRSTNGGDSFEQLQNTGIPSSQVCRITIGTTPANPDVVFALCCSKVHFGLEGLYKSTNSGVDWEETISGAQKDLVGYTVNGNIEGGQGYYNLSIAISPINENEVIVAGTHMWKSTDGGYTFVLKENGWQVSQNWIHGDHHELAYNTLNNVLYSGNDGGIYKSMDDGENWQDLSEGLQILQVYRIGVSSTDENLVLTGAQDNGSMKFDDGDCVSIFSGDGMECLVSYENPATVFASIQYGDIFRSMNGGISFTNIKPAGAGQGAWTTPFMMHPTQSNTLYAGYQEVFRSTDLGNSWQQLTSELTEVNPLEYIGVSPADDNFLFAATYFKIWKSVDGGITWEEISDGLPPHSYPPVPLEFLRFFDMALSSTDPNTLWVTLSHFEAGEKVYKTTDGGQSWENISGNLPNFPANCIVHQHGTNDGIYVGTDAGVFYTDNDLNSWFDISDGLPNVVVTELEIQYQANKIVAGTFGRGLWESPLFDPITEIAEQSGITDFKVFPNPTDGFLQVEIDFDQPVDFTLVTSNNLGREINQKSAFGNQGKYRQVIDLSHEAKGVYIISLEFKNQKFSRKVVYQ